MLHRERESFPSHMDSEDIADACFLSCQPYTSCHWDVGNESLAHRMLCSLFGLVVLSWACSVQRDDWAMSCWHFTWTDYTFDLHQSLFMFGPSVLWRCWLGGRKGIWPVKTEWWGAGVLICLERGADLHMAQLMPLPLTISCLSKIRIGSIFLVLTYLGSPGKGPLNVCVCLFMCCINMIDTQLRLADCDLQQQVSLCTHVNS